MSILPAECGQGDRLLQFGNIFAEKLILEKGKIAYPVFTEPIQLILRISEVLRRSEEKKEDDLNQSLVATMTKNSFSSKKKLQPSP